jgi:hypothetical protein
MTVTDRFAATRATWPTVEALALLIQRRLREQGIAGPWLAASLGLPEAETARRVRGLACWTVMDVMLLAELLGTSASDLWAKAIEEAER